MSQPVQIVILSAAQTTAQTTASKPGQSLLPDSTGLFTTANFVLIAVLAVLVVIGLIYGARQHRRRKEARGELIERNETLRAEGVCEVPIAPTGEPVTPAASPPPAEEQADDKVPEPLDDRPVPPAVSLATAAPAPPASQPSSPPVPVGPSSADGPITQLKGLGPRVAERLAAEGITTVGQLAALTDDEASALDAHLGPFTGRMTRDRWLEQARFLAAGDRAGFEAVFGRL